MCHTDMKLTKAQTATVIVLTVFSLIKNFIKTTYYCYNFRIKVFQLTFQCLTLSDPPISLDEVPSDRVPRLLHHLELNFQLGDLSQSSLLLVLQVADVVVQVLQLLVVAAAGKEKRLEWTYIHLLIHSTVASL